MTRRIAPPARRAAAFVPRLAGLAFAALALVSVDACKPKAGDDCQADTCGDEKTLLACKNGKLIPLPCDGSKGCKLEGQTPKCDFSGNKVGSPCDDRFLGRRQCKGDKEATTCMNGKWAVVACSGGCSSTSEGDVKECTSTTAKAGENCDRSFQVKQACEPDGKSVTECTKDGKWVFVRHCRGAKGCAVDTKKGEVDCDLSVQLPGDPCTPPVPEICSADGAAILLCDGTKMFEKMCTGPRGCAKTETGVSCDLSVPTDGSPCDKKGAQSCTKADGADPAKLLECDGKKFGVKKRCPGGCAFDRPTLGYTCK